MPEDKNHDPATAGDHFPSDDALGPDKTGDDKLELADPSPPKSVGPPGSSETKTDVTKPKSSPAGRRRDGLLALWPILGIAGMAVLGELFGGGAALLVALAVIGSLVWFVGEEYDTKVWRVIIVGGAFCLAAPVAFFYAKGVPALREAPSAVLGSSSSSAVAASGVVNLRGRTVNQRDLASRPLAGAVLDGATINQVRLAGAHLENLQAAGTTFFRVDLADAHLTGADLRGAIFVQSDLRRADLARADLRGADLRQACLVGTDLTGASMTGMNASGAATAGVIAEPGTLPPAAQWQVPSAATTSADCP